MREVECGLALRWVLYCGQHILSPLIRKDKHDYENCSFEAVCVAGSVRGRYGLYDCDLLADEFAAASSSGLELLQPLLAGLAQIEPLLEFSDTGKKASKVVQQFAEKQRGALKAALHQFASEGNLTAALQVARAEHLCAAFPQLKSVAKMEVKKGGASSEKRKLLRQASELYQAELLAKKEDSQQKAVRALQRLVKRYPNSEAAARAQQKLDVWGE